MMMMMKNERSVVSTSGGTKEFSHCSPQHSFHSAQSERHQDFQDQYLPLNKLSWHTVTSFLFTSLFQMFKYGFLLFVKDLNLMAAVFVHQQVVLLRRLGLQCSGPLTFVTVCIILSVINWDQRRQSDEEPAAAEFKSRTCGRSSTCMEQ